MLCNQYSKGRDIRAAIVSLREEDPYITASEMSRKLGRSRERIRQLLVILELPTKVVYPIRFCEQCGGLIGSKNGTRKNFCSMQCYSDSCNTLLTCDNCGDLFKRRIAQIEYYTYVRGYEHYFCDRRCFGAWSGRNFGWHTARGYSRNRKEDEIIWQRRDDIISKLVERIRTSLLHRKEQ